MSEDFIDDLGKCEISMLTNNDIISCTWYHRNKRSNHQKNWTKRASIL